MSAPAEWWGEGGPGVYDDLCTAVRERAEAVFAAVVVIGGNRGSGFAVQRVPGVIPAHLLAAALREVADAIARQGDGEG
jgi:hypothetical protein